MKIRIDEIDVWKAAAEKKLAFIKEYQATKDREFEEKYAADYDKAGWFGRLGRSRTPRGGLEGSRYYREYDTFYPCITANRSKEFCQRFLDVLKFANGRYDTVELTDEEVMMIR